MKTAHATSRRSPSPSRPTVTVVPPLTGPQSLDDLAALDVPAAEALYRRGTVPDSLHALDGDPDCRMLAVRGLDRGAVGDRLRRFAAASAFPWEGKHFQATSDGAGTGINRVRLGGRWRWFPFETRFDVSAIDGQPCIFLDYESQGEPAADPAHP